MNAGSKWEVKSASTPMLSESSSASDEDLLWKWRNAGGGGEELSLAMESFSPSSSAVKAPSSPRQNPKHGKAEDVNRSFSRPQTASSSPRQKPKNNITDEDDRIVSRPQSPYMLDLDLRASHFRRQCAELLEEDGPSSSTLSSSALPTTLGMGSNEQRMRELIAELQLSMSFDRESNSYAALSSEGARLAGELEKWKANNPLPERSESSISLNSDDGADWMVGGIVFSLI